MNLIGKRFQNKSGKICTVKDINENVTTFEDNTRVETKYLLDKKYFVELPSQSSAANFFTQPNSIDPNNFLNNTRNPILEQIKSLSSDIIDKLPADNSANGRFYPNDTAFAIVDEDPELEKEMLAKKYNINSSALPNNAIEQANMQMNKLLNDPRWGKMLQEETGYQPQQNNIAEVRQTQPVVQSQPRDNFDYQTQTRQVDPVVETKFPVQNSYVDPIVSMFQKAKRTTTFKTIFEIDKKIPRLDFIEMMEDSYETSIIDYLAQEFTEQILSNPLAIKNKIADELRQMLDKKTGKTKEQVKISEVKPQTTKKATPKKTVSQKSAEDKNKEKI